MTKESVEAGPYRSTALSPPTAPTTSWFRSASWWMFGALVADCLFTRWLLLSCVMLVVVPLWIVLPGLGLLVRRGWRGLRRHGAKSAFLLAALGVSAGLAVLDVWAVGHGEASIIRAVERYRAREGHYPASLNILVPRDLDSIPSAGIPWSLALPFSYTTHDGDATLRHHMGFTTAQRYYTFSSRRHWGVD